MLKEQHVQMLVEAKEPGTFEKLRLVCLEPGNERRTGARQGWWGPQGPNKQGLHPSHVKCKILDTAWATMSTLPPFTCSSMSSPLSQECFIHPSISLQSRIFSAITSISCHHFPRNSASWLSHETFGKVSGAIRLLVLYGIFTKWMSIIPVSQISKRRLREIKHTHLFSTFSTPHFSPLCGT